MRKLIWLLLIGVCFGQGSNGNRLGRLLPGTFTVSALPTSIFTGAIAVVTDGNPGCATGGGSNFTTCIFNGSTWVSAAVTFPLLAPNGVVGAPSYSFANATSSGLFLPTVSTIGLDLSGTTQLQISSAQVTIPNLNLVVSAGNITASVGNIVSTAGSITAATGLSGATYSTATNCQQGGAAGTNSPAACGSAACGEIAVPASQTSYQVNTTAVTANSEIIIQQMTDNSGISTATCNSGATTPIQSARSAGTSFTLTLTSVASVTCFKYCIVN